MSWRALAIAGSLAACDPGPQRVTRDDCDDVLAHLVVLERDLAAPALCKYHAKCDGSARDRFEAQCPRVLARRELGCYQRATSLGAAEACLPLAALAERIETGQRGAPEAERDAGDPDYGWSITPGDRRAALLGELEQLRDATCACADPTCALTVKDRVDRWMAKFEALQDDPTATGVAMRLFRGLEACRNGTQPAAGLDGGVPTTGLPNCRAYLVLVEKMSQCSSVPQSTRESLQQSLPSLRAAYDDTGMSPDVRDTTDQACALGRSGIRDQLAQLGCL